jgi:hypothetical protein
MAKLYREFVLKERPVENLVQIGIPAGEVDREAVGRSGD